MHYMVLNINTRVHHYILPKKKIHLLVNHKQASRKHLHQSNKCKHKYLQQACF